MALACAEFLMPTINVHLLTDECTSRQILVEAVQALMTNGRRLNQKIRGVNTAWAAAIQSQGDVNDSALANIWGQDPDHCPFGEKNPVPEAIPLTPERAGQITPEEAMTYLIFLAQHYPVRALPVQMLATTYVACAKQGQITLAFLTKIEQGIETELGYQINLNADSVQLLFQHFGKNFDEVTAPIAFSRWQKMLPDSALRLRLTFQQVGYSRLTVFRVIEEAVRLFPDFGWPLISKLLPGDVPNFVIASEMIGNNPYYGFKKNLGEAASTRYRSLGWVAKELMIRGAGRASLTGYAGWPRAIPSMERVRQIIDSYLHRRAEAAIVEEAHIAMANDLLDACIENNDRDAMAAIWRNEDFTMATRHRASSRTRRPPTNKPASSPIRTPVHELGTLDSDEEGAHSAPMLVSEIEDVGEHHAREHITRKAPKFVSDKTSDGFKVILEHLRNMNLRSMAIEEKVDHTRRTLDMLYKSIPATPSVGPKTGIDPMTNW
jgi:hypothetical protein